jgi:hypothetical protein
MRMAPDGSFANGMSGTDGTVTSVIAQSDGKVLIGGRFNSVNGLPLSGIARINPDGSLDAGFQGQVSQSNSSVHCVAVQNDGKVLIGGVFTTVNGVNRSNIARLNQTARSMATSKMDFWALTTSSIRWRCKAMGKCSSEACSPWSMG